MKNIGLLFTAVLILFSGRLLNSYAHCDTMDGPVVADARKAIDLNTVNYVLKWVKPENEQEIRTAFELTMKVRILSAEALKLADMYFFETLVRIHRNGEGVAYTGIKPSGTPVDEKILAADKSIENGNLDPLKGLVPDKDWPELSERFNKTMALKDFAVDDVKAGREYIEAYVQFFHFAEGEQAEGHHHQQAENQAEKESSSGQLPWILSIVFLVAAVWLGISYARKNKAV